MSKNKIYCIKDGNIEIEYGIMPVQGRRQDIEQIRGYVKDKMPMREIVLRAHNYQGIRIAEKLYEYTTRS